MTTKTPTAILWRFASKSDPKAKPHEARLYADGSTSCNCPGWTKHVRDHATGARHCRHVESIELGRADAEADSSSNFNYIEEACRKLDARSKRKMPYRANREAIAAKRTDRDMTEAIEKALITARAAIASFEQQPTRKPAARIEPATPRAPTPALGTRRKIDLDLLDDED